jgi:hypothetical protein
VDSRKEFISSYSKPFKLDTTVRLNGQVYKLNFRHFSNMDSAIRIPAKYNFDTNEDFVTHNFISEIILIKDTSVVLKKYITKDIFNSQLTPELKEFATLQFPSVVIDNDSIDISYSVSIPVTDIGISISLRMNEKGEYRIKN